MESTAVTSKEQADAAGTALMMVTSYRHRSDRRTRPPKATIGLIFGMGLGTLVGLGVCYAVTGHGTPGQFIGQNFGGALGTFVGLAMDRNAPKRSKVLFAIAATVFLAIGAAIPVSYFYLSH